MSIKDKIKNAKESHLFDELSEKEKFEAILEARVKVRLITELEKIKTRIDEEVVYVNKWQVKNDSIKIIDTRISELKGFKQ